MLDRKEFLKSLNGSNLVTQFSEVKRLLLLGVVNQAHRDFGLAIEPSQQDSDATLLNSVGPAAAGAAVDFAINACLASGKLQNVRHQLNGNYVTNSRLIMNEPMEEYQSYSNVLRQFLLPRYAYLDFDTIVDPRHHIDEECGYPKFITPIMYRYMYDRDDVARRVVDIFPEESWATDPVVYETEDESTWTPFELAWQELCDKHNLLAMLYRMDRLAGIGHYGALLLGIDDGEDLEKPIDGVTPWGRDPRYKDVQRSLLYMRPFDEYLSFIHQYETDVMSPRYGLPKFYNLVFLDMTIDAAGASIGTRLNRRVHWSRVVHVADNLQSSLVFGIPRMQPMFNRLLDLRKIKGSSAEMLWRGGFPGLSIELDPQFVADNPTFDKDELREQVQHYMDGLQRQLLLVGMKATTLQPNIVENPEKFVRIQEEAIATCQGVPYRIWKGSEEAKMASSQDKTTWNVRLKRRIKRFVEPFILRNFIDRLIMIGIMPPPSSGRYYVGWDDLNSPTDEDKANLALKWTQALSQYVASGVIHFISPLDYMMIVLGLTPRDAVRIDEYIRSQGGYEKLKAVDPDQGAGQNGVRENNTTKGERTGTSSSRPAKRDTADKKSEGMSS
jgi:hypothetical protein